MTPTISPELQEQIEREAEALYPVPPVDSSSGSMNSDEIDSAHLKQVGYISGATTYAHYQERWEQAKKALEEIVNTHQLYRDINDENRESNHLRNIAYEALASWKEEGKEGKPNE